MKNLYKYGKYKTSFDSIEIDITYRCDLRCLNCDRSCRQAPSEDDMEVEQIERFIEESERKDHRWKRIRVMGGEPILHPEIADILDLLSDYHQRNPDATLEFYTNGYGPDKRSRLEIIPADFVIKNTHKNGVINRKFEPFNLAPVDISDGDHESDYEQGCWITKDCGLGFNRHGYYQCAVAAGIDRVFGYDLGLKSLPEGDDSLSKLKSKLCGLCGHFLNRVYVETDQRKQVWGEPMSESWKQTYENYERKKPTLSLY